jgi:hypothetical protein
MAHTEARINESIREQAVDFFQEEVKRRYSISTLYENEELKERGLLEGVSQEDLNTLKSFFLEIMYPGLQERERRDHSLHVLTGMLTDPASLVSFFPSVPRIAFRYGFLFPEAIRAGRDVIHAYHLSNDLENSVVATLTEQLGVEEDDEPPETISRRQILHAFTQTSLDKGRGLVKQVQRLVEHGKRRRLMDATIDILSDLKKSTRNEDRIAAVDYVIEVVDQVRRLAEQYSDKQIEQLVHIATLVENQYLDEVEAE